MNSLFPDLERLIAIDGKSPVALLRADSKPGVCVKLNDEGLKWARKRIANGSPFIQDWKLELVDGRS